ncbi:MAG TPA: hypothetical protein VER96_30225 [Polyangiaceae bacterium]|nr:hypothetical protein [Polyangiaceae bacterium]
MVHDSVVIVFSEACQPEVRISDRLEQRMNHLLAVLGVIDLGNLPGTHGVGVKGRHFGKLDLVEHGHLDPATPTPERLHLPVRLTYQV